MLRDRGTAGLVPRPSGQTIVRSSRDKGNVEMNGSTELLVALAQGRDADAFVELYQRFERRARAVAFRVLGCSEAINDALQDALTRAWERLPGLRDPRRFGTWFCGIVHNLAVNELRRRRGREPLASLMAIEDHRLASNPVERLVRREGSERLRIALGGLDELSRRALVMRYYDDQANEEIAVLLDLTPTATNMRLFRARGRLRTLLQSA